MRYSKWLLALGAVMVALGAASLFGGATTTTASGQDFGGAICGTIETKRIIMRDAWLACDVQCLQTDNQACIEFGRPNIKLSLNGFKMTGTTNEPSSRSQCSPGTQFGPPFEADGVHSKFDEVQIVGPGVVQRMKRHGIGLVGTQADPVTKAQVKKVTSHMNCYSGVFLFWNSEALVDEVVSVRNTANGEARPCGGICVTNSSRNVVRRSEVAGNGTTDPGAPTAPRGNDFGIGLVGESDFNLIEENGAGGNLNGLAIFPAGGFAPNDNLIKRNVFAGNPPTEVYDKAGPTTPPTPAGSDVRDFVGAAGKNRFEHNLCLTYTFGGTGVTAVDPIPCAGSEHDPATADKPKLPQFSGHQNN